MSYLISGLRRDKRLLERQEIVTLHSTYQHAINFIGESQQMYTILESFSGAPSAITVKKADYLLISQQKCIEGLLKEKQFWWGDTRVDFRQAQDALLEMYSTVDFALFVERLDQYLKQVAVDRKNVLIDRSYSLLEQAKTFQEISLAIGLGVGLTPTVDDFVVGILAVFNGFKVPLATFDVGNTTAVSKQALINAQQGYFTEKITLFLAEPTWPHFCQLRETGSTSGTDILYGMLKGTELIRRKKCLNN